MMDRETFRKAGHEVIDWIADYLDEGVENYPVLSRVEPGYLAPRLDRAIPESGDSWESIWSDFERHIMPGITHWQSPNFYAYFPANNSYPAILGDLLSAGLGVNGMLWSTSPAATELETFILDQLIDLLGLPTHFRKSGVIQDTASSASLCALLCGREQALEWKGVEVGLPDATEQCHSRNLMVYTSDQAHSSIEKAAMIAGIGRNNVRKIPSDPQTFAMNVGALRKQIDEDRSSGGVPCFVSATMGTTSSLAFDPLRAIGEICRERGIWFHVDGAMAGTALICPEFRAMADGLELADSYCFNPHKWMLTNFDLDAFYVRDPSRLVRTLAIMPEYLKAPQADDVINYRDWQVPLGRRFRALKLWFVLRNYGVSGIQQHVREHVRLARLFADLIANDPDQAFEVVAGGPSLNLVCFSRSRRSSDEQSIRLLHRINQRGRIHLTHTRLGGKIVLRLCVGSPGATEGHIRCAWQEIAACAAETTDE